MLEKPAIPDGQIIACLRSAYGLSVAGLDFLALGADANTAVYRAVTVDKTPYFVKLRSGAFDESSVSVPNYLSDRGLRPIIAPRATRTGRLWAEVAAYRLILYPFVESRDAYEVKLSARQWRELGAALRRVHETVLPPATASGIRREAFSPRWREQLRQIIRLAETGAYDDPAAAEMATYMMLKREEISELIRWADAHAATLQARPRPFVLCHSDLHAGNVVIDSNDRIYIVDWDQPIFAPKERDLMYPGGAQGFIGRSPQEEERLFYEGYGPVEVDAAAVAYYRFERIVEDLVLYGEDLLLTDAGGADRARALRYVKSNFEAGGTIEMAYRANG